MTHHAYLYEGSLSLLGALGSDASERFGFAAHGDPDVRVRTQEKFGIDEARALRQAAALKSTAGRALFVVGVSSITTEAQQALLKLFEEPQEGTVFVLLASHGAIIATLRSRMLPYPATLLGVPPEAAEQAKKFLQSTQQARSAAITSMLKDDEHVREHVRAFLDALEVELHPHLTKGNRAVREGLEDIARVRSYVGDRAPSYKMLLEHLAITLPKL